MSRFERVRLFVLGIILFLFAAWERTHHSHVGTAWIVGGTLALGIGAITLAYWWPSEREIAERSSSNSA